MAAGRTARASRSRIGLAAALLALLMLAFASVQSVTMQAVMALSGAVSADGPSDTPAMAPMAGMAMAAPPGIKVCGGHASRPGEASKHACPYCAAAAHAPLAADAPLLRLASTFVFTAYRQLALKGPRGPPSVQPRARGPPVSPRSVLNRSRARPARLLLS